MIEAFGAMFGVDKATAEALVLLVFGVLAIRADILLGRLATATDRLLVAVAAPKVKKGGKPKDMATFVGF